MSLTHRLSHLPFQTKVLLPVLLILAALPILTVTLVDRHVEHRSLLLAQERLSAAEAVLLNSLEIRSRAQQVQFKNAVNEPRFKAVTQLNDSDTMQAYLRDALEEFGSNVEALIYTPIDGSPSSSVRSNPKIDLASTEKALSPNIESALRGDRNASLSLYSGAAYETVSVPVYLSNSGYPIGCLSIAINFGDQAIAELKSLTHTEIILTVDSQILGSTLAKEKTAAARLGIESAADEKVQRTLVFDEHFHCLTNSIVPEFETSKRIEYVLLSSYETELLALKRTRVLLLSVSLGGIFISALIIYVLIRRITSPLRLLKEGADAVGRGELDYHVECESNDECGDLARAFNQMTSKLSSSRRNLETTVHELQEAQGQLIERGKQLRESEQGLRLIIEGARDHAIFTITAEGTILRWNAASERILGYATDEAKDLPYHSIFEDRTSAKYDAEGRLEQAAFEGESCYEDWRRRKDGSVFWADITLSKLEDGGFVEITRDITARREAEIAMREAREAAESSNRAKSEFLANMSHEFRTPMNGIIGMAGLLSSLELSEEQRELTDTIKISADNLLSIIDDVLDISRIEAGELKASSAPINLVETIEDALGLLQKDCEKKALGLHIVMANCVPASVITDPSHLRHVIVNVVGNAIKFTHHGGITVNVSYETESSNLRISVSDTGIGIPEGKLAKLFDPFYQVESSASREFGGTGLGLAISKNLVRLLGGTLSVKSAVGLGSTFTIAVPAPKIEAKSAFHSFPGMKALILVDDPIAQDALQTQLEAWKIDVRCQNSRPSSVSKELESGSFALLLVDHSATRPDTIRAIIEARSKTTALFPKIIRFVTSDFDCELLQNESCTPLARPISLRALNRHIQNIGTPITVLRETPQLDHPTAQEKPEPQELSDPTKTEFLADEHPLRLLVVEDNPINTKVLLKILKKLGYDAETAANGSEGLAAAESMVFDAILMDLQMPVMDGLESARRILASESIEHPIYISAFTSNAREEDRAACADIGMHDFVAKPARIPEVQALLQRAHAWVAAKTETIS